MLFLYILLSVILFITVLFLIPVRVTADYDNSFELYVSYLFLKIRLFPSKEKKDKKSKHNNEKKEDTEQAQKKKKRDKKDNIFLKFYKNQGFEATIQLIADTMNYINGLFGGIFKHFVFRKLFLSMRVSGSDAAETAIKYGKISSAVFPAMGYICSKAKVKKYDIDISPDFLASKDVAEFYFQFGICPIFITNSIIVFGFKMFKNVLLKLFKVQNDDNKEHKLFEKQVKKAIKKEK